MDGLPRNLTVLVPAAGSCRRFREVGITIPKGLIRFSKDGGPVMTMLEHIIPAEFMPRTYIGTSVLEPWMDMCPKGARIRCVGDTGGQADTVGRLLDERWIATGVDGPVLVLNSDCGFNYPLHVFVKQAELFGMAALVFPGYDDRAYSYVDGYPIFKGAAEKLNISEWALAGAYYFRSSSRLRLLIKSMKERDERHAGEFYMSLALRDTGLAVAMERRQLRVWGTPEDLARDPGVRVEDPEIEKILERLR